MNGIGKGVAEFGHNIMAGCDCRQQYSYAYGGALLCGGFCLILQIAKSSHVFFVQEA